MVGEPMTSGQVMARVEADKAFYDHSGGGVTFSGGEPFAQPAFLEELLVHAKRLGIRTAVETCGHADPGALALCEPFVDLFLYDLKVMDPARHERLTGASNTMILENLRTLAAKAPGRLAVRVPLVPGCTDDSANLQAIAAFLRRLGIGKVELIRYHTLGLDKYASFGRKYPLDASQSLSARAAEDAARIFHLSGLSCAPAGASGMQ
jgi:pyruvate formate lyase activating enzyme